MAGLMEGRSFLDLTRVAAQHVSGRVIDPILKRMLLVDGLHPGYPGGVMRTGEIFLVRAVACGASRLRRSAICGYATPAGLVKIKAAQSEFGSLQLRTHRPSYGQRPSPIILVRNSDGTPADQFSFLAGLGVRRTMSGYKLPSGLTDLLVDATQFAFYDPKWGRNNVLVPALSLIAR